MLLKNWLIKNDYKVKQPLIDFYNKLIIPFYQKCYKKTPPKAV